MSVHLAVIEGNYMQLSFFKQKFVRLITTATLPITMMSALPASADVMLGASLPNDGFSREVISDFNAVVPKDLSYVNVFSSFSHDWDNLYWQSKNVVSEGAMPMITWMPIDLQRRSDNLLPEIALGMWDDYINQWGTKLMAWVNMYPESERPRLAIRFAHEFNGNWYPYSNSPEFYQAAWVHIHDIFTTMGVNDHVDWIWSASRTNVDDYNDFTRYYPGDAYVDWTSLDGYNWGSNYIAGNWSTFSDIFEEPYSILVNNYPDKPIMIAETGSAEPYDLPNRYYGMYGDNSDASRSKSVWTADMLSQLESNFPAIRALTMFNINKELSWSMNQEYNTGLDSWIAETQSDYFTTDIIVASTINDANALADESTGKSKKAQNAKNKKTQTTDNAIEPLMITSNLSLASNTETVAMNDGLKKSVRALSIIEQKQLAKRIRKENKLSKIKNKRMAKTLKNLSKSNRKKLVQNKLSVVDY